MEISTTKDLIQRAIDSANKENNTHLELSSIKSVNITVSGIHLTTIDGQQYIQLWTAIKLGY